MEKFLANNPKLSLFNNKVLAEVLDLTKTVFLAENPRKDLFPMKEYSFFRSFCCHIFELSTLWYFLGGEEESCSVPNYKANCSKVIENDIFVLLQEKWGRQINGGEPFTFVQFYEFLIKNHFFLIGDDRQAICDIYIRRDALKTLMLLSKILPIEKTKRDYRDWMFEQCRPFDGEVSMNNVVNGFRRMGPEYEIVLNIDGLI
jgi:hypothetical protein